MSSYTITGATEGGFYVMECGGQGERFIPVVTTFAGTLAECLAFVGGKLRPSRKAAAK